MTESMTECIFCKIIRGELPSMKVYEDDFATAFLNIVGPVNPGHTLIVPNAHHENVSGMSEADAARLFAVVHRVGNAAPGAVGAQGFNIGVNNGPVAGQIVMHAHVHVMPRFENDGLGHWPKKSFTETEMREAADKIAAALKN